MIPFMKTTTFSSKHSMNRSPLGVFLLIASVLACFVLSPTARAVDPPPDGGYPNQNTAEGEDALFSLSEGSNNTAIGYRAMYSDTRGFGNTAIGFSALYSNALGAANTAVGYNALYSNTTGFGNAGIGDGALGGNTSGAGNTAIGEGALGGNTAGSTNTAIGDGALLQNSEGDGNTAVGGFALNNNTTGINNIGVGNGAGLNLTTGSYNIDIGNAGVRGESNTIRIGGAPLQTATYIAGIREARLAHGTAATVGVTADGQLGVRASSAEFEEGIKPMDKDSEVIFSLQPVTFHYKKDLDPEAVPQFGFVAEDVATVAPELVVTDEHGQPFTVRTEEVNAMLLNEFLKEHRKVQQLERNAVRQQKQIEALTAGLQKMSAQLELIKPASQTVINNQ